MRRDETVDYFIPKVRQILSHTVFFFNLYFVAYEEDSSGSNKHFPSSKELASRVHFLDSFFVTESYVIIF